MGKLTLINSAPERWITAGGILVLGLISPAIFNKASFDNPESIFLVMNSFTHTLCLWLGSRFIVSRVFDWFPMNVYPVRHLLTVIPALMILVGLVLWFQYLVVDHYKFIDLSEINMVETYLFSLMITLFITSIYDSVFFFMHWKQSLLLAEQLEKDTIRAQYETLKAQVNPHFLFNSLNTLMTFVEDNPKASEYIQNLSEFMRYMLGNREKEKVSLREELDLLDKYLYLQKSRFGDKLRPSIEVPDAWLDHGLPPLVLQMLAENAVKHNIISRDKPLFIRVFVEKNQLVVENNLQPKVMSSSTRVGLANIFSRIEHVSGSSPRVIKNDNCFRVELPLVR